MKKIFVCHPFAGDPEGNVSKVKTICGHLTLEDMLPIAPQIYFPQFLNEMNQRDMALKLCLELVKISDEVWVFGEPTKGMRIEIAHAQKLGIPVVRGKIE